MDGGTWWYQMLSTHDVTKDGSRIGVPVSHPEMLAAKLQAWGLGGPNTQCDTNWSLLIVAIPHDQQVSMCHSQRSAAMKNNLCIIKHRLYAIKSINPYWSLPTILVVRQNRTASGRMNSMPWCSRQSWSDLRPVVPGLRDCCAGRGFEKFDWRNYHELL